jgi:hypothetical protein
MQGGIRAMSAAFETPGNAGTGRIMASKIEADLLPMK